MWQTRPYPGRVCFLQLRDFYCRFQNEVQRYGA